MKQSRYNIWVDRNDHSHVFNGLTGALLRMSIADRRRTEDFIAGEPVECNGEVIKAMVSGGMLISDDRYELAVLASRYAKTRENAKDFALTIVTSLGCNFECPYCFEAKHPSVMDSAVQEGILRIFAAQIDSGISQLHVTWFGGEPLVGKAALFKLADQFLSVCRASDVDFTSSIITNGYLMDPRTAHELKRRGVGRAQITVDGSADLHNLMRPLANGAPTFDRIVENVVGSADIIDISIRVNLARNNVGSVEDLLRVLADKGLSDKIRVVPGHIVAVDDGVPSPSASFSGCFSKSEFAAVELEFWRLAASFGFQVSGLPEPIGAPCTAVRKNELVVGSRGELYKCWNSVGNPADVIGNIRELNDRTDSRASKWLLYDPFSNDECRACIALPVCMGGCAHHAMSLGNYDDRCGTFRQAHREQVEAFVDGRGAARQGVVIPVKALGLRQASC